jgi:hypothetical protein
MKMTTYGIAVKGELGQLVTIESDDAVRDGDGKTGLDRLKMDTGLKFFPIIKQTAYAPRLGDIFCDLSITKNECNGGA